MQLTASVPAHLKRSYATIKKLLHVQPDAPPLSEDISTQLVASPLSAQRLFDQQDGFRGKELSDLDKTHATEIEVIKQQHVEKMRQIAAQHEKDKLHIHERHAKLAALKKSTSEASTGKLDLTKVLPRIMLGKNKYGNIQRFQAFPGSYMSAKTSGIFSDTESNGQMVFDCDRTILGAIGVALQTLQTNPAIHVSLDKITDEVRRSLPNYSSAEISVEVERLLGSA